MSVAITRVVGPGTNTEFGPDGTLLNWNDYVANKVLSRDAYLSLTSICPEMGYCPPPPANLVIAGTADIYINGYLEKEIPLSTSMFGPHSVCTKISTEHLKFAHVAPPGQTPSVENGLAGVNTIVVKASVHCGSGTEQCGAYLGPGNVTFDAIAPVIMVHGIRSDGGSFDSFVKPFQGAYLSFKALHFDSKQFIEFGSQILPQLILQAANQFGAQHVHIVAHSKGGVWTREFLYNGLKDLSGDDKIGVYSVHTLDTPHHGSVAADLAVSEHKGAYIGGFLTSINNSPNAIQLNWLVSKFYERSEDDITVLKMFDYNRRTQNLLPATTRINGQTNRVQYFAYTGDANLNGPTDAFGFGIINCIHNPCQPYFFPVADVLYTAMQRWKAVDTQRDASGRVTGIALSNSPPYPGNDFVVTVPSAQYPEDKFQTISPTLFVNHSTVLDGNIGTMIVKRITAGLQ